MSLRLIYGRAGSGKSHLCLEEIKNKLKDDSSGPLILIVPEQFSFQAERNLLKAIGTGGVIRAEVLSFRRLAFRVFNEVGGLTRWHVNAAGKSMLIYRILDGMKDKLKIFSKAADQTGFIKTLSDTIAEFKRYNITPERLLAAKEKGGQDELLTGKLDELAAIYSAFEDTLHRRYMDSDDYLTMLVDKLEQSVQFEGSELWIDEFTGFTPQEYSILDKLLKKAKRVNISLCSDCTGQNCEPDATDVFAPVKNTVGKLLRLVDETGVAVDAATVVKGNALGRFAQSEEMKHLEDQYSAFPYSVYPKETKDIHLFSSVGVYSEVEHTARDIISLCRDRGYRFRDIAVVARNLEDYEKLISVIFTEYGIPFFIDRKRDLNCHPLVVLVLSALDILADNWSYETVFRYLKTGLTGLDREQVDLLENYVLACGIRGKLWIQEEPWGFNTEMAFTPKEKSEAEILMLNQIDISRRAVTVPLVELREKTRGRRNAREISTALFDFLCNLGVPDRMEKWVEAFRNMGDMDRANEYRQVWNTVMEVFDQIVEILADETMGVERFKRILEAGFGEYKLGLIPPSMDQVLAGSVERSKSQDIKALYILGANDRVFPAASSGEGILSDREREILGKNGVELAQDSRTKAFEEQYLIYSTLTTPHKYLTISFPVSDFEGKTLRPSIIISRMRKLFPSIHEKSDIVNAYISEGTPASVVTAPIPTFNLLVEAVRKKEEGQAVEPYWKDIYRWYRQNELWKERCRVLEEGFSYSNQDRPVDPLKVQRVYGTPMYTSISRLESYASCPFRYFAQFGLKAKERKIFRLNAPDVGTFMHDIIHQFSLALNDRGMGWRMLEREQCSELVSFLVEQTLEKLKDTILTSSKRYRYLAERLKRVLTRAVWLIAEHVKRSGFEPVGYEVAFGEPEGYPPITLELASGNKICLTGRIDRMDALQTEDGTYIRIVDYKSGMKDFRLADAYYGLQIQLIAYMDCLWENGGKNLAKPVLPAGILYFRLDDPMVKRGVEADEEAIEKAIMKQLKMKGLLLADVKLIREMDRQMDGDSMIIPARINKGEVLGRSSAATKEQFGQLREHVRRLLVKMGEEILMGDVSIRPYKKQRQQTACQYCSYASVCQFDLALKDNRFKLLKEMPDEEVWTSMGDSKKECE